MFFFGLGAVGVAATYVQSSRLDATIATDILTFLRDREKTRPKLDILVRSNESVAEYKFRTDKELKDYQDYETSTGSFFEERYWPRTLQVLTELKLTGFNVDFVWYRPSTAGQIEDFAIGLGNVAERGPAQ